MNQMIFKKTALAIAISLALSAGIVACGGGDSSSASGSTIVQAVVSARGKSIITADGFKFKDLNGNGKLDPYEDWRLSPDARADNLINSSDPKVRMTLAEKLGMMLNSEFPAIGGNYPSTEIGGTASCANGENSRLKSLLSG